MAIANGTCVSFCNQPKAQFGYLIRGVTPVCRCLHPFCGWRHLATSRESKAHFGLSWVRPLDNRGKCYMIERGFNACQTHRSMYPSSTVNELWRDIGRKLQLFPTPLHLTPRLGCSHWNSGKMFGPRKTRIMGLPGSEDSLTIG